MLLHGLGSCADDLEYQVEFLSQHFRVIAPDLRGHGNSDRPLGNYEISDFCADVFGLLDWLGVDKFHLMGYSMGGSIALQMSHEQPERVDRLILCNTQPEYKPDSLAKLRELFVRLLAINVLGMRRLSTIMSKRMFPHAHQDEIRRKVHERFSRNDTRAYLASIHAIIGWSSVAFLPHISSPVLIIAGELDYFPLAEKQRFVDLIPQARMEVISNSGHGTPMEQPDLFNTLSLSFLTASDGYAG